MYTFLFFCRVYNYFVTILQTSDTQVLRPKCEIEYNVNLIPSLTISHSFLAVLADEIKSSLWAEFINILQCVNVCTMFN